MNGIENVLAKKYAQAFLNLYLPSLSFDDYRAIKAASLYLKKNYAFFSLLNIPIVPLQQKRVILFSILEQLKVPALLSTLVELLIRHQRIFLVPALFTALSQLYEQRKKISPFVITSAHGLDDAHMQTLKNFLEKETQTKVIYEFLLDKKLIAGIRMQSPLFLWEYSLAKQLNTLYKTMK